MNDIIIKYNDKTVELRILVAKDPDGIETNNVYWLKSYSRANFKTVAKSLRNKLDFYFKNESNV